MKYYRNIWKDKKTNESLENEEIANSIEEAIKNYDQENEDCMIYVDTVITDERGVFLGVMDLKEEMRKKEWLEMSDFERNWNIEIQRGFDDAKYGD